MSRTSASVPLPAEPTNLRQSPSRWKMSKWLIGVSTLLLIALILGGAWIANSAATAPAAGAVTPLGLVVANHALPYKTVNGAKEKPPLKYLNNIANRPKFVQRFPTVFLIFWGPKWFDQSGITISDNIFFTFSVLGHTSYNGILAEYTPGHFSNALNVDMVVDSSTPPANMDLGFETPIGVWNNAQGRHEADKEIKTQHWNVNRNDQIIIFPQKGSTFSHGNTFCGVHSFDSTAANSTGPHHYAYAFVQYGDKNHGCNFVGNTTGDIIWNAVHEYTEMLTDPQIFVTFTRKAPHYIAKGTGWHTQDSSQITPQEVADLCGGYSPAATPQLSFFHVNGFPVPYLWSNKAHGCVK